MNRKLASQIADLHFAPTENSSHNLIKEGVPKTKIFVTGNTVVDSLNFIAGKLQFEQNNKDKKKQILITGHRRENFGEGFKQLCTAIKELALEFNQFEFIFPVHLNPNVQKPVNDILSDIQNIKLIPPIDYVEFLKLMYNSYLILSDSGGGGQEEAPSFRIPILVIRNTTERPKGVQQGIAKLVGTDKEKIITEVSRLIKDENYYNSMLSKKNPYGDGFATVRIIKTIESFFKI